MKNTAITISELQLMSDDSLKAFCRKYSLPSQWKDQSSLAYAQYRLSLIQGFNYLKTGDINSFKKTMFHS